MISRERLRILLAFIVFICFVLICIARAPDVLLDGRFWAEEGTLFWANARESQFAHLWFVPEQHGYLSLATNMQTLSATWLPIRVEPLWTAWTSVLIMSMSGILVLLLPLRVELRIVSRLLLSVVVLFCPPALEPEVFANSINSQVFFGVFVATTVLFDWSSLRKSQFFLILSLIALSILSSPYAAAVALVPLVQIVVTNRKSIRGFAYSSILVAYLVPLFVQVAVQVESRVKGLTSSTRFNSGAGIVDLSSFLSSNFVSLFVGRKESEDVFVFLINHRPLSIAFALVFCLFWAAGIWLAKGLPGFGSIFISLVVAHLSVCAVVLFGYLGEVPGSRYQVSPSLILTLELFIFIYILGVRLSVNSVLLPLAICATMIPATVRSVPDDNRGLLSCVGGCISWQKQATTSFSRKYFFFWPGGNADSEWKLPVSRS